MLVPGLFHSGFGYDFRVDSLKSLHCIRNHLCIGVVDEWE
jgi:hypothetical protein